MTLTVNKTNNKSNVFTAFQNAAHAKNNVYSSWYYKRNHRVFEADTKTKAKVAAGAGVATLLPMIYFAMKQNKLKSLSKLKLKHLVNIRYELPQVIGLSTTSIAGGVAAGIIADKKSNKKRKLKEGVFQFMNATIPTLLVGGALNLIKDNVKYKDSRSVKFAAIVTGLIAGMPLAAWLSNIINDPKDKEPDRKLTLKDSIVNMDDALGAFVIAKIPFVEALHLDKLMPAIFAWCGYRAGQSN